MFFSIFESRTFYITKIRFKNDIIVDIIVKRKNYKIIQFSKRVYHFEKPWFLLPLCLLNTISISFIFSVNKNNNFSPSFEQHVCPIDRFCINLWTPASWFTVFLYCYYVLYMMFYF